MRFYLGITVGVITTYAFYFFLYCLQESIRVVVALRPEDLLVLSSEEITFYKLIFAAFASIIGVSSCILFWQMEPLRNQKNRYSKYKWSIIQDQIFLNYWFLAWSFKMSFLYFIVCSGFYDPHNFALYPDYKWMIIAMLLVLFLHVSTSIRRVTKSYGFQQMLMSFLIIVFSSFILSNINVHNREKINHSSLSRSPLYKYAIKLPHIDSPHRRKFPVRHRKHFVIEPKKKHAIDKFYQEESLYQEYDFLDVIEEIEILPPRSSAYHPTNYTNIIYADSSSTIKPIMRLKDSLLLIGFNKFCYAYFPHSNFKSHEFHSDKVINLNHYSFMTENEEERHEELVPIYILNDQEIMIKKEIVDIMDFTNPLNEILEPFQKLELILEYDDRIKYITYLKVVAKVWELLALEYENGTSLLYCKSEEELNRDERKFLFKRYPHGFRERSMEIELEYQKSLNE